METKNIAWIVGIVGIVLIFIFLGVTANATTFTPSTNDNNEANGWAYVEQLTKNVGSTELKFTSTRNFMSCFEYRTDGDISQQLAEANQHTGFDDLYPYFCQWDNSNIHTIHANEYVEVRMVFGAEGDERFDWTRFDVIPAPTPEPTPTPEVLNEPSIGDGDVEPQDTNCADLDALTEEQALGDCNESKVKTVKPVVETLEVVEEAQEVQKEELVVFPSTGYSLF